jgi:hypothetical protein
MGMAFWRVLHEQTADQLAKAAATGEPPSLPPSPLEALDGPPEAPSEAKPAPVSEAPSTPEAERRKVVERIRSRTTRTEPIQS